MHGVAQTPPGGAPSSTHGLRPRCARVALAQPIRRLLPLSPHGRQAVAAAERRTQLHASAHSELETWKPVCKPAERTVNCL